MSEQRKSPAVVGSLKAALEAVGAVLSVAPHAGMIIGGIAVIAQGVPRTTRDVDATIDGSLMSLEDLVEEFRRNGITARIVDAIAFAAENQVLLLRHEPSGTDIDVSMAWLPFELEAIASAEVVDLGNVRIRTARPEDLLIYKAIAWRPQDQYDAERLLTLHGKAIDLNRVRRIVAEFAEVLEDSARSAELECVIERTVR